MLAYAEVMSDQQPTPEAPRDSETAPQPDNPGAAAPTPAAPPPPSGSSEPPVWPAHAAAPAPPPYPGSPAPTASPVGYPAPGYPVGYPAPGYGAPGYAYPTPPTTSTNAIVGLVLAILSWVLCPIVPAIVALVLAKNSDEEIRASGGRVSGEGLNIATRIVSWINIGVWGAILLIVGAFFLVLFVAGIASSSR